MEVFVGIFFYLVVGLLIWNERTLIFGVPILSGLISSQMIKEQNKNMAECMDYVGISFIYLFVIFEFNAILSKFAYLRDIIFFDLANVDAVYKIAAFLCLGIVLMLVSYFYTKNRE